MMAVGRDERLRRLAEVALDILQLALVAGDVRVALFYTREMRAGRDPSMSLAEAVETAMQRHAIRPVPPPAPPPLSREEMLLLPDPPPPAPRAMPQLEVDFPHIVHREATPIGAQLKALAERGKLDARLDPTADRLVQQVVNEAERFGTAVANGRTGLAGFAEERHAVPGE